MRGEFSIGSDQKKKKKGRLIKLLFSPGRQDKDEMFKQVDKR